MLPEAGLLIIIFIVAGLAALWALEISRATGRAVDELEKINETLTEVTARLEAIEDRLLDRRDHEH